MEFGNARLIISEGFFRAFFFVVVVKKVHKVNLSAFSRLHIHRGVILRHAQTKLTSPLSPFDWDSSSFIHSGYALMPRSNLNIPVPWCFQPHRCLLAFALSVPLFSFPCLNSEAYRGFLWPIAETNKRTTILELARTLGVQSHL